MSKIRVYELAKELNVPSKDIIELLKEFNVNVKNHMSVIEDDAINMAKEYFSKTNDSEDKEDKSTDDSTIDEAIVDEAEEEKIRASRSKKPAGRFQKQDRTKKNESETSGESDRKPAVNDKKVVVIKDMITVKELAESLKRPSAEVIKKLIMMGIMANINHELDFDTAQKLASQLGIEVRKEEAKPEDLEGLLLNDEKDKPEDLKPRPPVVTIMGHVDHGKTSLLDVIRKTHVTLTEAGGITQHIGAYTVEIKGSKITFLDTPGHEAFTSMRARGAMATDIAVLVVAADDGVMPQTIEAINHARAARVPIIVAINKIDKANANPDRVKQQLTEYGLVAEDWGGDTICVPVSAKSQVGIDNLLEMILLVAEMGELKANPNRLARGIVIESKLDKGRGPVATILVKNGTLSVGDSVIAGVSFGKVRAMFDDKGKKLRKATPSIPAEVLGFNQIPDAGDILYAFKDEKSAKQIVENRIAENRSKMVTEAQKVSLEGLFDQIQQGKVKDLNIIVKADVQGSVEAVTQSFQRLTNDKIKVNIIHGGVGAVSESDVILATASNAIIIGFNVRPNSNAMTLAEKENVDIRTYRIIYEAIDDVEAAINGMLEPEYREVVQGRAEVRATFKVSSVGTIAGCYVTEGKINRNNDVRIIRNGVVINEGKLGSLKRFKDDAKEVAAGYECGLSLERFNDIKEGDIVESFANEQIKVAATNK